MATTYQVAPPAAIALADKIILSHHLPLIQADVRITWLFAANPDGPAIRHHGWPAKALVKKTSLKERVAGLADAIITIDADGWREWTEGHRAAIIDHELEHIVVKQDAVGNTTYDDANRPVIWLKPHDFQFGGFHAIAGRHAKASAEAQALQDVARRWVQLEFRWLEGIAMPPEVEFTAEGGFRTVNR